MNINITAVTMPAPTLSLVVIVRVVIADSPLAEPELEPEDPVPALGLLVLFPPVLVVKGVFKVSTLIIIDWITLRADICWPIPYVPSHVVAFHS